MNAKKLMALLLVVVLVLSAFAGCNSSGFGGKTYTYNLAMSVFPTIWNPHTYETATSSDIIGYLSDSFYSFDYNENKDGFAMVPSMTTDEHPVDITSEYVGKFGIVEGDTAKVYKINLRKDLKWEDGTKITAKDFVESAKRLLNPAAKNYRADSLYSGDVVIYNAEAYSKQGSISKEPASKDGETSAFKFTDLVKGADGSYTTPDGAKAYFGLKYKYKWMGGKNALEAYYNAGYIPAEKCWDVLSAAANDEGYVPVTDETIAALFLFTGSDTWGNESKDDLIYYVSYDFTNPEVAWEDVGLFALSDYELVYAITQEMSGFYLKYGMPSGYLVKTDLYDKCESIVDGVYTNTYGTSAETIMSYGPYKLVSYQADKEFKFERNKYYFDLTKDTYQTTHIEIQYVPEITTREELLLSGKLDSFGLDKDYMEVYSLSDYCYYSESASVWAMVFNPNKEALEQTQANAGKNINKTILTVSEFRMAMSLGMDRAKFSLATMPTCKPAFGLLSSQHIVDPDLGTGYRTTTTAKEVLAKVWGVDKDYGEGKLYANLDEAVESITGYNPEMAKQKFNEAYDIAINSGLMTDKDTIQICIGLPSATSTTYNNGYEFIVNHYTELVKGTKLEGKLTFTRDDTIGDNFSGSLQNNTVDMLFYVGWSGMELNPYGLMQAYVDNANEYPYDLSYNYSEIDLAIEMDGETWTTSCYNWYEIMNGVAHDITNSKGETKSFVCGVNEKDPETRMYLLGCLEGAVLLNYNFIPLSGDASASIKGQQVKFYMEDYVYGMGYGGIKYMTYNFTDAEWDAYVSSQGGKLDYT